MSTNPQWYDIHANAQEIGGKVVWCPEELGLYTWIEWKQQPFKEWYVECTLGIIDEKEMFPWQGRLLWNQGEWQVHPGVKADVVPLTHTTRGDQRWAPFSDITHYHWWGLKGEKKPRQIILVPFKSFSVDKKDKRDSK